MVQYLINCSLVWIMSLISYELFLKKSTFHQYNRFFLLCSFVAGIIIPLLSFSKEARISSFNPTSYGIEKTHALKSVIVSAAQTSNKHDSLNLEQTIWIIYWTGFFTALLISLFSLVKTYLYYSKGSRFIAGNICIVETGKVHSPFSVFKFIFIDNRKNYTDNQFNMILAHESTHIKLKHSIDLILIQVTKLFFWFNPLVQQYRQRLSMIHEYQADAGVDNSIDEYGNFLLQQTFNSFSPQISHSLFHSPIKKRIIMLTRKKSSSLSKSKFLLAVPMLALSLILFSKDAFSDGKSKKNGNKVTFKGNSFEMSQRVPDTAFLGSNKDSMLVITIDPQPIRMNNEVLISSDSVDERPVLKGSPFNNLLGCIYKTRDLINQLNDGEYVLSVSQAVTGKSGKLLYYKFDGIGGKWEKVEGKNEWTTKEVLPSKIKEQVDQKMNELIAQLTFHPAIKNGTEVNCSGGLEIIGQQKIVVKNHQYYLKEFELSQF